MYKSALEDIAYYYNIFYTMWLKCFEIELEEEGYQRFRLKKDFIVLIQTSNIFDKTKCAENISIIFFYNTFLNTSIKFNSSNYFI